MRGLLAALLLVPSLAGAGRILDSSVTLEDGVYAIAVEARIIASPDTVFGFLTDYERLPSINSSIRESSIIHTYGPAKHRVHTLIRACILFFCRSVRQVQDLEQQNKHLLVAHIIPELSDFRQGRAEWRLSDAAGATDMHFTARLEPAFWVPPVIGPWLFRHKIVSELLESAAHMETAALEASGR
jgi:hypothetical protein